MESTAMITPGLARDLASLGRLGEATSTETVLRGLTTALAAGVPGCSGGSAEHWRDRRVLTSGSHSELITLVEGEREIGEGPSAEARNTEARVAVADVLTDTRWPRYAALATRCGVRSVLAVPIKVPPALLIVGLYSVRPEAFSPQGAQSLAEMLTEQVGVAMANMWDFDEVRTDAAQLQEALAGRALIDQAKGIIMQTSGCTAEAAFEELRRISQHHQVKVADLARLLVEEHQRKNRRR
ncbi:GAF and ANTAR domain-containing protein [Nonomuraea sp. MCN248]|uniref:GAF and ANTAR domain-containing protein n=1 Tax=Nonomuraea corallina TaxID=2989783 RepID=A0ABT4SGN7_9ACTN|nr:GAF and ANTAR domain-containing protein [Nonomuraea corallina]MDA0636376.1 GAF and ANTAR domain-containing protein [Nonomuraea corallina]